MQAYNGDERPFYISTKEDIVQRASLILKAGLTEARMEIQDLIEDYELQTKRLERVNELIKELCQQIRYADKLLEIKGIGITTVAGFIAEVGDITRFDSAKELQKLAGLELVADSSGKHNGKTKISKRGRKRLRYLLFEAAISVVGKNEEFKEIHRYYTTREKNPLKKMQSLVAGRNYFQIHAGKDLEMIFLFQSFLCFNISKTFWALHRKKRQRCCIRNSSIVYDYVDKNDGDSC